MSYRNQNRFEIEYADGHLVNYSVTVSRMSDSWRDNEEKPLELTTYIGIFVDGQGFTGMTIYDWDGPKMKEPVWMFQGITYGFSSWITSATKWLGSEKTLELIDDILGNRNWESEFTKYYQADRPR